MIPPRSRYRLRTFSALALIGENESVILGDHRHHHHLLALLAVLAAAGKSGKSRDQLLLLFWPDATESRARQSLDQLLYGLRGLIGESVFASTKPVCLDPNAIASDVWAFNDAIARDDPASAIELYRGPFLDGFHLDHAPEFEQWLQFERTRLAGIYADALERLARTADSASDDASAVRWWRELVELDPVSSRYATGLMRALMNAGDHRAALKYAERYQRVVAKEVGASVGPAVANLVAEVLAESKRAVSVARTRAIAAVPTSPVTTVSVAAPHDDDSLRADPRLEQISPVR